MVERGLYGWTKSDAWSLDAYLSEWMPDALEHLAADSIGIHTPGRNKTIQAIADGFRAARIMNQHIQICSNRHKKALGLIKKKQAEGFSLFQKHFHNLWD